MNAPNSHSILLVEDNADDEALTVRVLRRNGLANEIVVAHDGAEALDYLFGEKPGGTNPEELPQVVILDLKLPKIDGLEVLARIRAEARTRFLPVVILTSSQEEQDVIEGYARGANSFVVKPVEFEAFTDAIRTLGMYWLLLNARNPS